MAKKIFTRVGGKAVTKRQNTTELQSEVLDFFDAIKKDDDFGIKYFLKKHPDSIDECGPRESYGHTGLFHAAKHAISEVSYKLVKKFLELGAAPDAYSVEDYSPLTVSVKAMNFESANLIFEALKKFYEKDDVNLYNALTRRDILNGAYSKDTLTVSDYIPLVTKNTGRVKRLTSEEIAIATTLKEKIDNLVAELKTRIPEDKWGGVQTLRENLMRSRENTLSEKNSLIARVVDSLAQAKSKKTGIE